MDKENVVYILFSHKKGGNPAIYNNMDGPWGHYANEVGQAENDKYYMTSFTCEIYKNQAHRNREQIGGCQRQWMGQGVGW